MSDNINVHATLTADDRASPVLRNLMRNVDKLSASLKKAFNYSPAANLAKDLQRLADIHGDIASQVKRQTDSLRAAAAANRSLGVQMGARARATAGVAQAETRQAASALSIDRQRLAFGLRMSRQRSQEARQQEDEHRQYLRRLERERGALNRSMSHRGRDAAHGIGNGIGRATRSAGMVGALGFGATALAARKTLMAESDIDSAEINARAYAGLTKEAARDLRLKWAGAVSQQLGATSAEMIRSYVDAAKLGIPDGGAREFSVLSTKVAEAWDVNLAEVVDTLGTVNTLLTSGGKAFDITRIHSVANTMQHLAASMSTTPAKMISFMKRGAGASQLMGMSQEAGLAFGAASTSLGNEAYSSGRAFDFLAGRIAELPRIMKRNGGDAAEARKIVGQLGYNGIQGLLSEQKRNPEEFIFDFLDSFNRIKDTQKRNEALKFVAGTEWLGELGRMVTGIGTVRTAQKLAKEAQSLDGIEQVWTLHQQKLAFAFKQLRVGFLNVIGEAGMALSPVVGQIRYYFLKWSDVIRSGGLKARIDGALRGLIEGFGFRDVKSLMEGVFGKPGEGEAGAVESWTKAARGFAAGIRDVGTTIKTLLTGLSGSGDPEAMSRWTARILGFSMAARVAGPAVDFLAGLTGAILALGNALMMGMLAQRLLAISALLSGGAAVAGAVAGGTLAMTLAGVALVGGAIAVAVMNWDGIKDWLFDGPIARFLKGDQSGKSAEYDRDQAEMKKRRDDASSRAWGYLKSIFGISSAKAGELSGSAANPLRDLHKSAATFNETVNRMGASMQFASLSSGSAISAGAARSLATAGGNVHSPGGGASIGNGPVNSFGLGRRGILGGSYSSGAPGSGLFDAIIAAEGTAKGGRDPYSTVLGYGAYGSPDKALTNMTLNKVRDFGLQMRRAQAARGTPWNKTSSASGAFQIVGSTMADAAKALGMDLASTKFTPETQRAMAAWIAKRQGLGAWEGFKNHPVELMKARAAMSSGSSSPMMGGASAGAIASGLIPVKASNGQTVMMDPRDGVGQAFAGGKTSPAVLAAAQAFRAEGLAGGMNRFTGFNDRYHAGKRSLHASGLAGDLTLKDPSRSAEAAEQMRRQFRAAGLTDDMFRVIDEYKSRSSNWTAGHLHYQFNSQEAAQRYAQFKAQQAQSIASQQPNATGIASGVPLGGTGGALGRNQSAVSTVNSPNITINGYNKSPEELTNEMSRRMSESMNWRTHDVESELT